MTARNIQSSRSCRRFLPLGSQWGLHQGRAPESNKRATVGLRVALVTAFRDPAAAILFRSNRDLRCAATPPQDCGATRHGLGRRVHALQRAHPVGDGKAWLASPRTVQGCLVGSLLAKTVCRGGQHAPSRIACRKQETGLGLARLRVQTRLRHRKKQAQQDSNLPLFHSSECRRNPLHAAGNRPAARSFSGGLPSRPLSMVQ